MTSTATETATTWNLDASHTEVGFAVRHLMLSSVRGRFGGASGSVTYDSANPSKSKVDISIDLSSIDTRNEQRDNHLRSADFFDVANNPTMHFVSKRLEGDVPQGFKLIGDLTIKQTTHEVTLDVELEGKGKDPWGGERMGFSAKGEIDRRDFNVTWNQALEAGGVVVGEKVKINIEAELVRQA